MAHYKRKGPKSTRAGCLLCKPHKRQGTPKDLRQRFSATRKMVIGGEQITETLNR